MNLNIEKKLPFFNFFFTLAIVFYHADSSFDTTGERDALLFDIGKRIISDLGTIAMAFFFFVSAYLLFRTLTYKSYLSKIKRRVVSLLLPFLLWNVLCYLLYLIFDIPYTFKDFLLCFILETSAPDAPLWYMLAIFLFAVFSPVLYFLFSKKKSGTVILYALLLIIFVIESRESAFYAYLWNHGHLGNIFFYVPCYLTGAYLGMYREKMSDDERRFHGFMLLLICLLLNSIFGGTIMTYLLLLMPLFILCTVPYRPFMSGKTVYQISFLMYAIHWPFYKFCLPTISEFVCRIIPYGSIQNPTVRLLGTLGTFTISLLFYLLTRRFCPRVLSVLTGGRDVRRNKEKPQATTPEAV